MKNTPKMACSYPNCSVTIEHGGDIWLMSNLQALCISCHSKKSADDKWEYSKKKSSFYPII